MEENRTIPPAFKKFFWDGDLAQIKFPEHENYVLGKLMLYGNLRSIQWILQTFDRGTISRYLQNRGMVALDKKSFLFWQKLVRMEDLWNRK